jgi:phosphate transport system substrate-binding protein
VGLIKGPFAGEAQALNGAGATFPAVLYSKWFDEYAKLTNVKVNYQAIGSGGGIKGLQDATVDFGATDGPMSDDQLKAAKGDVLHIPMTLGAVVMTYNVPEAKTALKFTSDTIAGIYLGDIKKWNDPKLVADNPDLANVNKDIVVVHRSDGSGTTFAFTDYLSAMSSAWQTKIGKGTAVNWPAGLGAQGNAGVTGEVKQDPYAVGYVELIYAVQNKLGYGDVKNKSGKWVTPTLEGVTAAAAATVDSVPPDLRVSIVNAAGDTVYPISTYTWIIVYTKQSDSAKAIALTRLLWWAVHDGQTFSGALAYAPLPAAMVTKDEAKILSITVNGTPAFPGK